MAKVVTASKGMWEQVGLCGLNAFVCYLDRVNMSYAVIQMQSEFGFSQDNKAWVLSSFFWGYLLSQIIGAQLAMRLGGKLVLGFATLGWSITTLLLPFAADYSFSALITARVLLGIFEGCAFPCIYHYLGGWVTKETRSRSVAALQVGAQSGIISAAVICPFLLVTSGWRSIFFLFSCVGLVWCLLWAVLARDPPSDPAEVTAVHDAPCFGRVELAMLRHPPVRAIFWCHYSFNYTLYLLLSWLPSYFHSELKVEEAGLGATVLPFVAMAISSQLSCASADRAIAAGTSPTEVRHRFTIFGFVGAAGFLMTFPLLTTPAGATVCLVLALATLASAQAGYESSKFDVVGAKDISRLQGLSNTIATTAGVVGVQSVDLILVWTGSYFVVFATAAAILLSAAGLYNWQGSATRVVFDSDGTFHHNN